MDTKDFNRVPGWLRPVLIVGLIGVIGFLRFDVTSDVRFQLAPVVAVKPILDRPWDRFVTVVVDDMEKTLRVSDRHIKTTFGQTVCVQSNRRLLRTGRRYGLALPVYCRGERAAQSALAAHGEGAYL